MTHEDLQAQIEQLKAENRALRENRQKVTLKVSPKGAVSAYGLGRFPVTLYKQQWESLLGMTDEIRKFLSDNESSLSVKE
jgi:hypothetical protein